MIFGKLGKKKYSEFIGSKNLGSEIHEEFITKESCSIKRIINWLYFTENLLNLCSKLMTYYQDVSIAEFYDNNFKLKILNPRTNSLKNTIGFLFGLFEDYV